MAGPILAECRVSVSQEDALASLGGGWERSGLYSLDETPSQNFSPARVLLDLHAEPPASYEGDSGSESSDSVDRRFSQEPVEWMSPPSSSLQVEGNDGGEGNDGAECNDGAAGNDGAEGSDGAAKEDSYAAAFESDRSQSPSQDWHGQVEQPEPQIPNFGASAEFLTQPVAGLTEFEDDEEDDILRRETIPLAEFQGSSVLLATIPEHAVEAPVAAMELSQQPFTQPAFETQPPEHLPFEFLNKEPASETLLGNERNGNVQDAALLDEDMPGAVEPEPMQQGSGSGELVKDALDNENGCAGEKMPRESGVDHLPRPVYDGKGRRYTQQEHESHVITKDVPRVDVERGDSGNAQLSTQLSKNVGSRTEKTDQREEVQASNRETRSPLKRLKRVKCAEEHHGRQKLQRIESSPVGARSFPKTVMDVVRSRSRSLSNSLVDDECNILSIIMRAGVSFPPFLHEKHSV